MKEQKKIHSVILVFVVLFVANPLSGQGVVFNRDFSPAEGLVIPQENPYREEICLNGTWDIQPVDLPADWEKGIGIAPELTTPMPGKWDAAKIKIPSAINVNNWGDGLNVGEGTNKPYAPSSVYYPSYPSHWADVRMAWLKRNITIPQNWSEKRMILHFEAVAGDCVVYINGLEAGRNFDSYLPFEIDITDYIKEKGNNEILVGLRHRKLFDKSHPEYTKFSATYPPGSNTDDLIGIWQDVFLFGVPEVRVTDVFIKPWLERDELELEIQLVNQSKKKRKISLEGDIKEWLNKTDKEDILTAPEINWGLGNTALAVSLHPVELKPGETKTIIIKKQVTETLKKWTPETPNLYTLLISVKEKEYMHDCKAARFGWRQFSIEGKDFHLNGEKIQCFGDIQHPFSAYICSRRFAWAWYKMIKDFGGNALRPHAQPWPRMYYDLADEMGLMVLDETALFGSSIRLNLEEDVTWERSQEHLDRLILRDRNHPSVIGWSAGNEMFAIALLNKPEKEVSDKWDEKMVKLTLSAKKNDPTRNFITLDGDRDMDGRLPVWSKHFGHGLQIKDLPMDIDKPLIVGEMGATYYGRPIQLYPFAGEKAFESYYGRSEALAIDLYQNVVQMARPHLAYFSPSEVCWFGIEHLNLGYHDYSRIPGLSDGIFAGNPYVEGKPGYQYERIPPYVTTFNPGLDPDLPLYKPLPMFEALKAALSESDPLPSPWDTYPEKNTSEKPVMPDVIYKNAALIGSQDSKLYSQLDRWGIDLTPGNIASNCIIVDGDNFSENDLQEIKKNIEKVQKEGGMVLVMLTRIKLSHAINELLPANLYLTERQATALENNKQHAWGGYFDLPSLYFAEMKGDKKILKIGLSGDLVTNGYEIFTASRTDWSLFINNPENRKCAQAVLYEHLQKPEGAALVSYESGKATFVISALDYTINTRETFTFWQKLFSIMGIQVDKNANFLKNSGEKEHDLLMNGPVN